LNLDNLGSEADPDALIDRFRSAYDQARSLTSATATTGPNANPPAAAASPLPPSPVAPAPAIAVSADPALSVTGTPSTTTPQTIERCVTARFGPTNRQIAAAASATFANRPVWVLRVVTDSTTVDLIIETATCAEVFRRPVS
jgi:hypothetical protein